MAADLGDARWPSITGGPDPRFRGTDDSCVERGCSTCRLDRRRTGPYSIIDCRWTFGETPPLRDPPPRAGRRRDPGAPCALPDQFGSHCFHWNLARLELLPAIRYRAPGLVLRHCARIDG